MTIDTLIMFSGAFVALLPFLGFPSSWDKILFLVAGVFTIGLGIMVRRKGDNLYRKPIRAAAQELKAEQTNEAKI